MKSQSLIQFFMYLEPLACVCVLFVMAYRGQLSRYRFLAAFLFLRGFSHGALSLLLQFGGKHIEKHLGYQIYFYTYWLSYAVEALLGFAIIYSLYHLAMAPLKGLQRLGTIMFRWAAGIAVALATTSALGPHVTQIKFVMRFVTQLQQTQSILTLSMLLFVCLAIRPMGLSYRSRIFGVSLGLGVLATADLVASAWLPHAKSLYSLFNVLNGISICVALGIWTAYFALPEPKRRMIILPTTAPFLRWNQISAALGDAPGFVAIGEVTPDMFAPAEVEIMQRASLKMPTALMS